MKRRILRAGLFLFVVALLAFIIPNIRALYEGLRFYLYYAAAPSPIAHPVQRDGRYASLYDLVALDNAERFDYLARRAAVPGATVVSISIPNSTFSDLLVYFDGIGPHTVYAAHYDKLHDDPAYQGASDNTAAVSVLLASLTQLAQEGRGGKRAFLFTGEEENGLRGASAFVAFARISGLTVREVVNFDNLGRGGLAIRPSAPVPGYAFTLPFYGDLVYDGRALHTGEPYSLANARLARALTESGAPLVVLERFTALSDSNVFQANGIDTVAVSGDDMRYLDETWHTYTDRVELLDEGNLNRGFDLIMRYPAN